MATVIARMARSRSASAALFAALVLLLCSDPSTSSKNPKPARPASPKVLRKIADKQKAQKMQNMKAAGQDQVSMTKEAAELRSYELRKKKRKGLLKRREASLAQVLFPGASPEDYLMGEPVPVFAELVESKKTQVPFEFYDLPTCAAPTEKIEKRFRKRNNLGTRLMGHAQKKPPFEFRSKLDRGCTPLCLVEVGEKKLRWLRKLVDRQYRMHLTLDQLPVLMRSQELNYAVRGYPVGFKASPSYTGLKHDEFYLYNHLKFTINYREEPSEFEGVRIIGFDVHPVSIKHELGDLKLEPGKSLEGTTQNPSISTCTSGSSPGNMPETHLALRSGLTSKNMQILYSYEVNWVETDIPWADRWDVYLVGSPDDEIHYFAIVNSLMIVLFLTGAVATILVRTLKKDIAGYNELQTLEEAQEETGWKLVHGDVFRPPQTSPLLLSVLVGTGAQIGSAFFITLLASMMRLLNPVKKGQTLTAVLILFVFCGCVSGYVSARLYKFCDAKAWKRCTVATAIAFPSVVVGMFMFLNIFLTVVGAATAVSFLTIFFIFFLWACVATPLVFVGSYFGYRAEKVVVPTKTNQIARFIPDLPYYALPPVSCILAGLLPFGSVCIELFFIMSALWLHQLYYIMGFLMAVLLILCVTCAEVAMVMCYLQLCSEDHRWWWKSFLNCSSAGIYLFVYSLWFLVSKLDLVGVLPVVVYLTYMSMISMAFGLMTGTVGYLACFWFTKKIYAAVKVD